MKTIIHKFVAAIIIIVLIISLILFSKRFEQSTDDAYVQADISVASAQVNGEIISVKAKDYQTVHKDEPIVIIDDQAIRARLDQAKSQIDAQRANVAIIEQKIQSQPLKILQAQNTLSSMEAEFVMASNELSRAQGLLKEDFSSKKNFDVATAGAKKASAALNNAKAELDLQQQQMLILQQDLLAANALLDQLNSAMIIAERDLVHTIVTSPIDGFIANKLAQVGNYARQGAPLFSVVPNKTYIVANFKETQITHMKAGQKVKIELDAFPKTKFTGHVTHIAPGSGSVFSLLPPDNATGNFTKIIQRVPVRIDFDKTHDINLVIPGLSAIVTVDTKK